MTTLHQNNIMCRISGTGGPESLKALSITPVIDISDNAFARFNDLEELNMEKNEINILKANSFTGLNKLHTLKLNNCRMTIIEAGVFSVMPSLRHLKLSGNNIQVVTGIMLGVLPNLEVLELDNCHVTSIEKKAFKGLPKLKILNLSGNQLDTFCSKRFIRYLPKLEVLDLSNNPIFRLNVEEDQKQKLMIADIKINLDGCKLPDGQNILMTSYELFKLVHEEQVEREMQQRDAELYDLYRISQPESTYKAHAPAEPPKLKYKTVQGNLPFLRKRVLVDHYGNEVSQNGGIDANYHELYLKYKDKNDELQKLLFENV